MMRATLLAFVVAGMFIAATHASQDAPVVVVGAVVQPMNVSTVTGTGFQYAGLEPVQFNAPAGNLQPAKVIGDPIFQGMPVVNQTVMNVRPRIVNTDGSDYYNNTIAVQPVQVNGQPAGQPFVVSVAPHPVVPEAPKVFTSPATPAVPTQVPAFNLTVGGPFAAAAVPVAAPFVMPTAPVVPEAPYNPIPPTPYFEMPNYPVVHPFDFTQQPPAIEPNMPQPVPAEVASPQPQPHLVVPGPHGVATLVPIPPTPLDQLERLKISDEAAHNLKQEVNRLVELVLRADSLKKTKQAKKLRRNLRRILRRLRAHGILHRTVETAIAMTKISLDKKRTKKHAKKALKSIKLALDGASTAEKKADKALAGAVAASKSVPAAPAPAKAAAPAAPAKTSAPIQKVQGDIVKQELTTKLGASAAEAILTMAKKVDVLSKSALAFESHLKKVETKLASDSAAILGLNKRVDGVSQITQRLEKAITAVNKDIRLVTERFNRLAAQEKKLTLAAKRAISNLAQKVNSQSAQVKLLAQNRGAFNRGVFASLAELESNAREFSGLSEN